MNSTPPPVQFRTASLDDIEAIAAMWDATSLASDPEVDRFEIRMRLQTIDEFFVVGELDGAIVTSAMGCSDGHRGHVKRVCVDPQHQSTGLGQAVMAEVERRFQNAGITKLRLQVWKDNLQAAAFWEAGGWRELPEIRYFTKDLLGEPDNGC